MFQRLALVILGLLVLAIVGLGIWVYTGGPFRLWIQQMATGGAYMRSLKENDMPAWIDRSTRLLAEYRPGMHPVGVYDGVVSGKPIPPELRRLKIIRIDIFQDRVCFVWMGGMDHTYLEARRLPDGSLTFVAHYNDYQSEVIWPKRPNQAMHRTRNGASGNGADGNRATWMGRPERVSLLGRRRIKRCDMDGTPEGGRSTCCC